MDNKSTFSIGNTPCLRASNLSKILGKGDIYLKLENGNPTQSHKDRIALKILGEVNHLKKSGICTGSCGSYGLSLAWLCHKMDIDCNIFIPLTYNNDKIKKIGTYTDGIIFVQGSYEDAVEKSKSFSKMYNYLDANPIGEYSNLCQSAYMPLAYEVITDMNNQITAVWLPVGNGTTFAGLHRGFSARNFSVNFGLIGSVNNSAVIASLKAGQKVQLSPKNLVETPSNEPLISWLPPPDIESLIAITNQTKVYSIGVSDEQLNKATKLLKKHEGIVAPPYSCAGLAGFINHSKNDSSHGRHLILITS